MADWKGDDNRNQAFCANLSLFGKLFIDHKTIFYDVRQAGMIFVRVRFDECADGAGH